MIYHILFNHSSVDGHLRYFHCLAIIDTAMMNICVQVFMWPHDLIFGRYIPKSGIAGSYGNFNANLNSNS